MVVTRENCRKIIHMLFSHQISAVTAFVSLKIWVVPFVYEAYYSIEIRLETAAMIVNGDAVYHPTCQSSQTRKRDLHTAFAFHHGKQLAMNLHISKCLKPVRLSALTAVTMKRFPFASDVSEEWTASILPIHKPNKETLAVSLCFLPPWWWRQYVLPKNRKTTSDHTAEHLRKVYRDTSVGIGAGLVLDRLVSVPGGYKSFVCSHSLDTQPPVDAGGSLPGDKATG